MKDESCICFLQWALPHLHMHWPGFKKVRGQVCKRLGRRLDELELADLKRYRMYLEDNPLEWHILDSLCRITISRFYRDKGIYDSLRSHVLPELIKNAVRQDDSALSCWCIGSASGEEPYSVSLLWDLSGVNNQDLDLKILATEVDQLMINRARKGCYPVSSIRELPSEMKTRAFTREDVLFCITEQHKKRVHFLQQDIRNAQPDSAFHLILCRNLVFTYFSRELQEEIIPKILLCLKPGGALVIGSHEELPGMIPGLAPWLPGKAIYRREG
jgi:chemotaxis protein methyltransferase CheR